MSRLKQLQQFLEQNPDDSFITFAIAKEYEKLGDMDNALAHYLSIESKDSDYVGLYYHLGKLYENQADTEKALLTYKKGMAVAKKANDNHAYNELAGAVEGISDE